MFDILLLYLKKNGGKIQTKITRRITTALMNLFKTDTCKIRQDFKPGQRKKNKNPFRPWVLKHGQSHTNVKISLNLHFAGITRTTER